ncbi:MAG: lactate utilization protein [Phycisphaerales bacterium]|nr:lactate utilization protein [Phycisphaerales bacterium]
MTSRDAILSRIRRNLAESSVESEPTGRIPLRTLESDDRESLVRMFAEQLELVNGVCHRTSSFEAAAEALRAILVDHHVRRIARSGEPMVIDLLERVVGTFELFTPESPRPQLLDCDLGLCTATLGIAEHGTIMMTSGQADLDEARVRLVSLVPKIHVAVLRAGDLVGTVAEALDRLTGMGDAERRLPPVATFATGPSRTADIEQQLVLGVHGPHSQHVILLEDG